MEDIKSAVSLVDESWTQYFINPKNIYVAKVNGEIASFCLVDLIHGKNGDMLVDTGFYSTYKSIIKYWKTLLRPGGSIIFEVGEGQAETVKDMLLSAGFRTAYTRKDTLDVDRAVIGTM